MIYSVRKGNETFDSFFRRFQKRIQTTGNTNTIKQARFKVHKISKNQSRKRAIKKRELTAKREYLIKSGKLQSDEMR